MDATATEARTGNLGFSGTRAGSRRTNAAAGYVSSVLFIAAVGAVVLLCAGGKDYSTTTALMLAFALFVSGAMTGFLFGVPKARAPQDAPKGSDNGGATGATAGVEPAAAAAPAKAGPSFVVNNNLEEISDWLTKMVVGVGLTQFDAIKRYVLAFADRYGSLTGSPQLALAMILFFFVCGFMFGYLWTTLFYPAALGRAKKEAEDSERDAVVRAVGVASQALKKAESIEDGRRRDIEAGHLVTEVLDPRMEPDAEAIAAMQEAVQSASAEERARILAEVSMSRSAKWRDDKAALPPMIPVLEALIAADPDSHRPHGELGFVLKDQPKPDYAGAIRELTTAIALRQRAGEGGWLNYEFNRALCAIAATPDRKDAILADLRAAAPRWQDAYKTIPAVVDWSAKNGGVPAPQPAAPANA